MLKKIANASNKQDIFLICTEIDRTMCHRSILGEILNEKIAGNYSNNEIRIYCNGHKIDIDTGCFASKQIALLDLDTLEPIYFRLEEGNEWN